MNTNKLRVECALVGKLGWWSEVWVQKDNWVKVALEGKRFLQTISSSSTSEDYSKQENLEILIIAN